MTPVLVLAPHPDDEAIGCGGALRLHARAGDEVWAVFLTSGERGGHGRPLDLTARLRETEAQSAAHLLGLAHIEFWRQPDGALRAGGGLALRLAELIARVRPGTIYVTHDAEMHPDHRAAARLLRRALAVRGDGRDTPEVRMYEVWTPLQTMDVIVDVSEVMPDKLAAIRAHASQCDVVAFDEAALGLNRYRGELHSWPGGDYAEVFRRMRL